MDHAIDLVVTAIVIIGGIVFAAAGLVDTLVAGAMHTLGIPPGVQFLILAVVAIVLMAYAVRALGQLLAGLILVLLVLVLLHHAFPDVQVPPHFYFHLPGEVRA